MRAPCCCLRRATTSAARFVISTRLTMTNSNSIASRKEQARDWTRACSFSKEAKRLSRIAYQDVLGVLIVVEHHLVIFAPDAGLLVSTECGMSRISMITVRPHTTGL